MYNVEKYIGKGLDSLLAQTFQNFEVIVVDDCSTDNSVAVVESYVPKFDERLKLYHMKKNSGKPGLPRNKGIMLSRGEYILFMDSDDKFAVANAIEEMYTLVKYFNADLLLYTGSFTADKEGVIQSTKYNKAYNPTDKIMIDENLPARIQGVIDNKFWSSVCRFLIKRDLMIEHDLFFQNVMFSEDRLFSYGLLFCSKRLLIVPRAVYVICESENSVTRTKRDLNRRIKISLEAMIVGLNWLEKFMNKLPFFQENPQYCHAVLNRFTLIQISTFFNGCSKNSFSEIYTAVQNVFGDKLGEHTLFVAALYNMINTQQKNLVANVQHFQQFAAQAQKRIAELESKIRRLNEKE